MHTYSSILCLNGTLPSTESLKRFSGIPLIATDGAAQALMELGHWPDVIVGDCDSLEPAIKNTHQAIVFDGDQDTCDFEKALFFMKERQLFPALVCGISGGELDHQHNNLNVFMRHGTQGKLTLLDEQTGYSCKRGYAVDKELQLTVRVGATVSLLAYPYAKVTTKGLQWALCNEELSLLGRNGARNCATENTIEIKVDEGLLLLIVDS